MTDEHSRMNQPLASGGVWLFPASPKLHPLVNRVVPAEEAERRVRAIAPLIPITRVSDLTPLDPLRLPVFAAVTPRARDLTTHLGKGKDATAARVSAMMEAVERVSAESVSPERVVRATFRALEEGGGPRPVEPPAFDLPDDGLYLPDTAYSWVAGRDLLAGQDVMLPVDLVQSPPAEGLLREVDTNGLAAGSTLLEAVVHALCEVIERDAQGQLEFFTLFGGPRDLPPPIVRVDPETMPDSAGGWLDTLSAHGLDVTVHHITNDVGVTTFWTLLADYHFPTEQGPVPVVFSGAGTSPHAEAALLRSITEAVQSRVGFIQGARDSYNELSTGRRAASRDLRLRQLLPTRSLPFPEIPSFVFSDLREELAFLLARLSEAGLERVIAVDLTRPDLGIPVVRVRVPGLSSFLVNKRRINFRCLRHLLAV
jgi:ribosomal protein S12 methylthiotransferase accessory factor